LITGCNIETGFQDLGEELFAPGIGYIESPGRRIAPGRYENFSVRAPTLEERFVVAFNEDSEIEIIRFEEAGERCTVGRARAFGITTPAVDIDGPEGPQQPLLAFQETRDSAGRGTLKFTTYDCQVRQFEVAEAPLPGGAFDTPTGPRHLLHTGLNTLVAVDPWIQSVELIASDVTQHTVRGGRIWTVESGEVVLRDNRFMELGRAGQNVSEAAIGRDSSSPWAAYVDDGDLYVVDQDFIPQRVDGDACGVRQVGDAQDRVVRYFSPCADRHLAIWDHTTPQRFDYVDEVITTSIVVRSGQGFDLNYWTGSDPRAEQGALWIQRASEEPVLVAEEAIIETGVLYRSSVITIDGWDGSAGNLIAWQDGETTSLAEGVAEQNGLGILADYEDGVGNLYRFERGRLGARLGEGVPRNAVRGQAFVANRSGRAGDLMSIEKGTPKKIATGVTPRGFLYSVQLDTMLMFLSDLNEEDLTAQLQVRLTETGDQFSVSTGVTELLEVGFPKPGILYNVQTSERQGLWFAGVR
jgi:hypothetical protein